VTGATGLLGANLVRQLRMAGHTVRALVRSPEKARTVLGDVDVEWVAGDMDDVPGFASALAGSDVLFHAAAYFREYYGSKDPAVWNKLESINVAGSLALVEHARKRGVARVIYASAAGVLGKPRTGGPCDEACAPGPDTHANLYFRSKWLAEQRLLALGQATGLPIVHLLPCWMMGPYDAAPTAGGQFLIDFVRRRIPAVTAGGMSVVDARDVAAAMVAAATCGRAQERYVVGGRYFTTAQLADVVAKITGVPAPRLRVPYPAAWLGARWMERRGRATSLTVAGLRTLRAELVFASDKAVRELGVTFRPIDATISDSLRWLEEQHRISPLSS
jgi:dihydroflavonol-4-reductase